MRHSVKCTTFNQAISKAKHWNFRAKMFENKEKMFVDVDIVKHSLHLNEAAKTVDHLNLFCLLL